MTVVCLFFGLVCFSSFFRSVQFYRAKSQQQSARAEKRTRPTTSAVHWNTTTMLFCLHPVNTSVICIQQCSVCCVENSEIVTNYGTISRNKQMKSTEAFCGRDSHSGLWESGLGVTSCWLIKWSHFHHSCETYQISALIRGSGWSPEPLVVCCIENQDLGLFFSCYHRSAFSCV